MSCVAPIIISPSWFVIQAISTLTSPSTISRHRIITLLIHLLTICFNVRNLILSKHFANYLLPTATLQLTSLKEKYTF